MNQPYCVIMTHYTIKLSNVSFIIQEAPSPSDESPILGLGFFDVVKKPRTKTFDVRCRYCTQDPRIQRCPLRVAHSPPLFSVSETVAVDVSGLHFLGIFFS